MNRSHIQFYVLAGYQLDFTTPGSFPLDAISRKQIRHNPNFLIYALGLPQIGQRVYVRTPNFGFLVAFTLIEVFAKISSSRWMRTTTIRLQKKLSFKGHSHQFQQFTTFFIGFGRGNNRNIQSLNFIDFIVINFRENNLFFNS